MAVGCAFIWLLCFEQAKKVTRLEAKRNGGVLTELTVIIIVSIAIMSIKDNALQDWLERTQFGILDGHAYPDSIVEQAEFKLAMAEMRG